MKWTDLKDPLTEISFWHWDGVTNEVTCFPITTMWKAIRKSTLRWTIVDMTAQALAQIAVTQGVEEERLNAQLARDVIDDPIMCVEWEKGTHTVIDGSHRVSAGFIKRQFKFKGYILKPAWWRKFVLEEIPPWVVDMHRQDLIRQFNAAPDKYKYGAAGKPDGYEPPKADLIS